MSLYRAKGKGSSWLSGDWIDQEKNADSTPSLPLEEEPWVKSNGRASAFTIFPLSCPDDVLSWAPNTSHTSSLDLWFHPFLFTCFPFLICQSLAPQNSPTLVSFWSHYVTFFVSISKFWEDNGKDSTFLCFLHTQNQEKYIDMYIWIYLSYVMMDK